MDTFELNHIGQLRAMATGDLDRTLRWRNAAAVRQNMYSQHEITPSEHFDWWERVKTSQRDRYFVFEQGFLPLGVVSFNDIDTTSRNAFWAFYASPKAPKGTGSRMEALALEYAFNVLGLHKLCCEVLEFNKPVRGLHKKFGFEEEGFFKEQRLIGANFVGVYRLAIASAHWKEIGFDFISAFDPKASI